jgi:hypothetical protein
MPRDLKTDRGRWAAKYKDVKTMKTSEATKSGAQSAVELARIAIELEKEVAVLQARSDQFDAEILRVAHDEDAYRSATDDASAVREPLRQKRERLEYARRAYEVANRRDLDLLAATLRDVDATVRSQRSVDVVSARIALTEALEAEDAARRHQSDVETPYESFQHGMMAHILKAIQMGRPAADISQLLKLSQERIKIQIEIASIAGRYGTRSAEASANRLRRDMPAGDGVMKTAYEARRAELLKRVDDANREMTEPKARLAVVSAEIKSISSRLGI